MGASENWDKGTNPVKRAMSTGLTRISHEVATPRFYPGPTMIVKGGSMGPQDRPGPGGQAKKWMFAVCAAALVSACAKSGENASNPKLGLSCVDDSHHCISQREKVFDSFMADKSKAWVKQPAGPDAYASGVRLFAFSKRRKELSCDELARGKSEADGAPGVLRGPDGKKLTPAQVSRGVILAGDVSKELSREIDKRCKKT